MRCGMRCLSIGIVWVVSLALLCLTLTANDSVAVVTGPQAPEIEKFAAKELCAYLKKLFGVQVSPNHSIPTTANEIFLIGSPATNPLIAKSDFPTPSDHGIVLRSM